MDLACFNGIENVILKILRIDDDDDANDEAFWSMDRVLCGTGYLSYASVKARPQTQDFSHVHVGPGTFFGVYDGHHGAQAAEFVSRNILDRIIELALERGEVSGDVIRDAVVHVDNQFVDMATEQGLSTSIGTCCTVGLIWGNKLCVADLGDSILASARFGGTFLSELNSRWIPRGVMPIREEPFDPREEIQPDDPHVFHQNDKAWRASGSMPVWKCVGDGYVKLEHPMERVHVATYTLKPVEDQFLICASHGLWDHLSLEEAVEIVQMAPIRKGVARKLAREAMKKAVAEVRCMRYTDLKHLDVEERRAFHDDITVIVVFLDVMKDPVDAGDCYRSRMLEPFARSDAPSELHRMSRIRFPDRRGKKAADGIFFGAGASRSKDKGKGKAKVHQ